MASRAARLFERADAFEQRLCRRLNQGCTRPAVRDLFRIVSRLGDGVFWYVLILLIPVAYGEAGLRPALVMALVGLSGVLIYKALKERLVRERPYVTFAGLNVVSAPLDRYSFPSGHTLHAVSFALFASVHFPGLGWVLVPFAALVATSRVVLGLHYPSDVLAGALLGGALGGVGLAFG